MDELEKKARAMMTRLGHDHWHPQDYTAALDKIMETLRSMLPPTGHVLFPDGRAVKYAGEPIFTADGVLILHRASVWVMGYGPELHEEFVVGLGHDTDNGSVPEVPYVAWGGPDYGAESLYDCYSTREAAEAARAKGGEA